MEILKLVVPAATGALGLVKLLDKKSSWMRVVTTVLIITGGAGSAVLVQESGKVEERRAVAAEQAQLRAEEKLDRMTDALLDIQQDLAGLQIQLAKAPQGTAGSAAAGVALKATLQKVDNAKQILKPSAAPGVKVVAPTDTTPAPVKPVMKPAVKPAAKPATGDK
jgi:hypothetical protein